MTKDSKRAGNGRNGAKNPRTPATPTIPVFNEVDIQKAVMDIADIAERTQIPFIMLKDLARSIRNQSDKIEADHLEFGCHRRYIIPEIDRLFVQTWKFNREPDGYSYTFSPPTKWDVKIPIKIKVWKRDYSFFKNPERSWFRVDDLLIANPFEKYWKARWIIQ